MTDDSRELGSMIVLQHGLRKFTHRVAAVAIRDEHVLLNQAEGNAFWYLPGGRVELMETASDALRREMREEMDVEIKVGRLLWVIENYFRFEDISHHELGLYFLVELPDELGPRRAEMFTGVEGDRRIEFRWLPLRSLEGELVFPSFLKSGLIDLTSGTQHIVYFDEPDMAGGRYGVGAG